MIARTVNTGRVSSNRLGERSVCIIPNDVRVSTRKEEKEQEKGKRRTFHLHNLPPMPIGLAPQLNDLGRQSRHSTIVRPSAGLRELFEEDKVSDGSRESCQSASE
jgi:hypothetical protein